MVQLPFYVVRIPILFSEEEEKRESTKNEAQMTDVSVAKLSVWFK